MIINKKNLSQFLWKIHNISAWLTFAPSPSQSKLQNNSVRYKCLPDCWTSLHQAAIELHTCNPGLSWQTRYFFILFPVSSIFHSLKKRSTTAHHSLFTISSSRLKIKTTKLKGNSCMGKNKSCQSRNSQIEPKPHITILKWNYEI